MLDIMSDFFSEFLQTFTAFLISCNICKRGEKRLKLPVLLKVFEFLKLGLIHDIPLEALEVLLHALLDQRLSATLRDSIIGILTVTDFGVATF